MTDLVLTPAACYPVYPALAARGPLPAGGLTVDAGGSYVFRHEPSGDPARLQMFHQREIVRIGEPDDGVRLARCLARPLRRAAALGRPRRAASRSQATRSSGAAAGSWRAASAPRS